MTDDSSDQRVARVDRRKAVREDHRQAWRFVGAGFVLVAIGMFGLVAGLQLSGRSQSSKVSGLTDTVKANHARIVQLEGDYRRRNIPIPPTTTTPTTAASPVQRRRVAPARTPTTRATTTSSTTSTTRPTTTTTTAPCRVNVAGRCIGGRP